MDLSSLSLLLICIIISFAALEGTKTGHDLIVYHRAKKVLEMIQKRSCRELMSSKNCTFIKTRPSTDMNFYMAEKLSNTSSLSMLVPLRPSPFDLYKHLDAVVVVDPMPDAHFGHSLVVSLVKVDIPKTKCDQLSGIYYTSPISKPECMYLPRNNGKCLLTAQLSPRKRRERLRRACSFDFIPFVYDTTAVGHQQLKCHSITRKFAKCPKADVIDKDKCKNKFCPPKSTTKKPDKGRKCGWSCDYALLVSGGWSKYINRIRHLHNIQEVFKHLQTSRSFDKENIKVYFANNATIELDGDLKAKETVPAIDALTITRHVRSVCSRNTKCIDTFVIYLNGPTTKNGDLLLWDWNADGKASSSEILTIGELLYPLSNCNAKNYLIIADQNYAGHIVDYVDLQRKLKRRNFDKIHVLAASNKNSYTWKRDFTRSFIEKDDNRLDDPGSQTSAARRISSIAKDLSSSTKLKRHDIRYLAGSNPDLTLTGNFGQKAGCS